MSFQTFFADSTLSTNHSQPLVSIAPGIVPQHNQTLRIVR